MNKSKPLFWQPWLFLPLLICSNLLSGMSQANTSPLPWALTIPDGSEDQHFPSLEQVQLHAMHTIGAPFASGMTGKERDAAADPNQLGYHSEMVEQVSFSGEIDLTNRQGLIGLALLVDDDVNIKITHAESGELIAEEFINGSAFWQAQSFRNLDKLSLCGGSRYQIELDYKNTANFSQEDGSQIDYDGISLYAYNQGEVEFLVFPQEPTQEWLAYVGEHDWGARSMLLSVDDPELWVQATVYVEGKKEDGTPTLVPAEDGTEVRWELIYANGTASLSSQTSTTENGLAAVKLSTSKQTGDEFQLRATLTKLKLKQNNQLKTIEGHGNQGIAQQNSQIIEIIPGYTDQIALKTSTGEAVASLPADGKSTVQFEAKLTDSAGNPVPLGTDVTWQLSGMGRIQEAEYIVTKNDGTLTATIRAGTLEEEQTLTVYADGIKKTTDIANTSVPILSLSSSREQLDIAQEQTTEITLLTENLANGAEVTWETSKGKLISADSTIENNRATATLLATSGTIGDAVVLATVGDRIENCIIPMVTTASASVEVERPALAASLPSDTQENLPKLDGSERLINLYASRSRAFEL